MTAEIKELKELIIKMEIEAQDCCTSEASISTDDVTADQVRMGGSLSLQLYDGDWKLSHVNGLIEHISGGKLIRKKSSQLRLSIRWHHLFSGTI